MLTLLLVILGWALASVRSAYLLYVGLRDRWWRGAKWWAHLLSVSLFAALAVWLRGLFSMGLNVREECQFTHHQLYDAAYRDAHTAEYNKWFPLHSKCNAGYDMVPAWVNPVVVLALAVSLVCLAVLVRLAAARRFSRRA
ncbi:hypothetical protein ABZ930_07975 [Streptomyces sp. NPDC046716]|uniref:hypothetical protein n=1 Tax=Streptomyces sp. NPDC046716 TaxID=3157093 RepID=UPI003411C921